MTQEQELIISLTKMNEGLMNELSLLREQVAFLTQKLYGKSSEKSPNHEGQLSLFDLEETQDECHLPPQVEETITYSRKKPTGKRQEVFEQFVPEEHHYRLEGQACTCQHCRHSLKEIGSQCYRQELVYIPAQLKRIDHIQHAYKCEHCSQKNHTDVIIKAPVSKGPIAHSLGSASIIAHSIHKKFELKVPNYRQEKHWVKMGLPITRKELSNWHLLVSHYYLLPLYECLKKHLLAQAVMHADETSYRVLESESPLTYYWTFTSGKDEPHKVIVYHHDQHRSGQVAQNFLGDYSGYIHCDMHSAYRQLEAAQLVGCWAHVRRKFFEASPKKSKDSLAAVGLTYCDRLFKLEAEWESLDETRRYELRQEKLRPLMEEFFEWCRQQNALSGSKLGKAIQYALNYEATFKMVLMDGRLVLSNNLAERAIKSLVMGRKNWLFSQSFEGARSTAIIMSIIESAKCHDIDAEKYMTYLLDHLPNEETLAKNEVLEAYLPWHPNIQKTCR